MNEKHPMTATSPTTAEYLASPNRVLSAVNGIDYAYRDVGEGTPPLVLWEDGADEYAELVTSWWGGGYAASS